MNNELAVQTYLRSGKTLDSLTAQYLIRAKVNEALGVVMLNYNQIALFWLCTGILIDECLQRANPDRLVEWLGLDNQL